MTVSAPEYNFSHFKEIRNNNLQKSQGFLKNKSDMATKCILIYILRIKTNFVK